MAANTLTQNLKLRLNTDLTVDSRYNLQRLDNLASIYQIDTTETAKVRSQTDILIQPNDPDIGGIGSGGLVSIGTASQPADSISLFATSLTLSAAISSDNDIETTSSFLLQDSASGFTVGLTAPSLAGSYSLTMPVDDGTANQVLSTDGDGNLEWVTVGGVSIGQEFSAAWTAVDGLEKTINHGFGSQQIMVQVLDATDDYKTIEVDVICRPTTNTVVLSSSVIPINWVVLLKEIP